MCYQSYGNHEFINLMGYQAWKELRAFYAVTFKDGDSDKIQFQSKPAGIEKVEFIMDAEARFAGMKGSTARMQQREDLPIESLQYDLN
jgi:hypothetical protein